MRPHVIEADRKWRDLSLSTDFARRDDTYRQYAGPRDRTRLRERAAIKHWRRVGTACRNPAGSSPPGPPDVKTKQSTARSANNDSRR